MAGRRPSLPPPPPPPHRWPSTRASRGIWRRSGMEQLQKVSSLLFTSLLSITYFLFVISFSSSRVMSCLNSSSVNLTLRALNEIPPALLHMEEETHKIASPSPPPSSNKSRGVMRRVTQVWLDFNCIEDIPASFSQVTSSIPHAYLSLSHLTLFSYSILLLLYPFLSLSRLFILSLSLLFHSLSFHS